MVQTQRIAISVGLDLVRWHLEGMFGSVVDGVDADHVRTLRVSFLRQMVLIYSLF